MRTFNTVGACNPTKHYMVDLSDTIEAMKGLVSGGYYFTVNRPRQYGKTTTLIALQKSLRDTYYVLHLDLQGISDTAFRTEESFVKAFSRQVISQAKSASIPPSVTEELCEITQRKEEKALLDELFAVLATWCDSADKPVVMLLDEVDSASNNEVFLNFLSQLRKQYLARERDEDSGAFQSVVLAGVTNIRHLKAKIRPESSREVNSPWNIETKFDVDMSLSEDGIRHMLDDYAADHIIEMDTVSLADQIREYTSGYPLLVSRICQIIAMELVPTTFHSLDSAWTAYGVDEAVKVMLREDSNLFDSLTSNLQRLPEMKVQLRGLLMRGEEVEWASDNESQRLLRMYGFITDGGNRVRVSNRIFEMRLYNYFIQENRMNDDLRSRSFSDRSIFVQEDGALDVRAIMEHFIKAHNEIHGSDTAAFVEKEGRERFLTYLSPIINGTGTYSIEEQTRDAKRMDVVIHFLGRRYIIELKIWHGAKYNLDGESQVMDYLDYFTLTRGYMLSFSFNKSKKPGVSDVWFGDKLLVEGIV